MPVGREASGPPPLRAEAAQFALLKRLAPSLRHRLIGGLHPISLLAELAGRRLAAVPPDLASARDAVGKIQAQARLAATSSIATIAWITGEESPSVGVREGLDACVSLLRTDCEMRGAAIACELPEADMEVSRRAVRTVVTAAIVAAVDATPRAARVELAVALEADAVSVTVTTGALQEAGSDPFPADERPLTWDDVEVLAQLEGVEAERAAGGPSFRCRFRRFA
jgi:hypothetical protein